MWCVNRCKITIKSIMYICFSDYFYFLMQKSSVKICRFGKLSYLCTAFQQ